MRNAFKLEKELSSLVLLSAEEQEWEEAAEFVNFALPHPGTALEAARWSMRRVLSYVSSRV